MTKKSEGLAWKYCECGCHGSEFACGGIYFWNYYDLKGKVYLHSGHGRISPLIGVFDEDSDEPDNIVRAALKKSLEEIKKVLK